MERGNARVRWSAVSLIAVLSLFGCLFFATAAYADEAEIQSDDESFAAIDNTPESQTMIDEDGNIITFGDADGVIPDDMDAEDGDFAELGDPALLEDGETIEPMGRSGYVWYPRSVYYRQDLARNMLTKVNALRKSNGRANLTWDGDLEMTAMQRAAEITLFFDHTRPSGQTCWTAFPSTASGTVAENIAANGSKAASTMGTAFDQWVNSEGHRNNMLNTSVKRVGIACAAIQSDGHWIFYWVQCFATSNTNDVTISVQKGGRTVSVPVTADTVKKISVDSPVYVGINGTRSLPDVKVTFGNTSKYGYGTSGTYVDDYSATSWTSANTSVAGYLSSPSRLVGHAAGKTTGTVTMTNAPSLSASFEIRAYRWIRLAGPSRFSTMSSICQSGFPSGSQKAIVATGLSFPDALSASALAGTLKCPIITTDSTTLSDEAASELSRMGVREAYITGGTGAVGSKVEASLKKMGITVTRLTGSDRYGTSLAIYDQGAKSNAWGDTCIVASGENYADALSISSWAYAAKAPIFLAKNKTLSADAIAKIKAGGFTKVVLVGGTGVVADKVKSQLGSKFTFTRLAGGDRYLTSAAIYNWATGSTGVGGTVGFGPSATLSVANTAVASGANFPDALASVDVLGPRSAPLLLVAGDKTGTARLTQVLKPRIGSIPRGYILGGTGVVPTSVDNALWAFSS